MGTKKSYGLDYDYLSSTAIESMCSKGRYIPALRADSKLVDRRLGDAFVTRAYVTSELDIERGIPVIDKRTGMPRTRQVVVVERADANGVRVAPIKGYLHIWHRDCPDRELNIDNLWVFATRREFGPQSQELCTDSRGRVKMYIWDDEPQPAEAE